jgi:hypothetical protein
MRIDNVSNLGYDRNIDPVKSASKASATAGTVASLVTSQPSDGQTRTDRIASLKQQFASGKPIDVQKLATTLVQSGVFFDENT